MSGKPAQFSIELGVGGKRFQPLSAPQTVSATGQAWSVQASLESDWGGCLSIQQMLQSWCSSCAMRCFWFCSFPYSSAVLVWPHLCNGMLHPDILSLGLPATDCRVAPFKATPLFGEFPAFAPQGHTSALQSSMGIWADLEFWDCWFITSSRLRRALHAGNQ